MPVPEWVCLPVELAGLPAQREVLRPCPALAEGRVPCGTIPVSHLRATPEGASWEEGQARCTAVPGAVSDGETCRSLPHAGQARTRCHWQVERQAYSLRLVVQSYIHGNISGVETVNLATGLYTVKQLRAHQVIETRTYTRRSDARVRLSVIDCSRQ